MKLLIQDNLISKKNLNCVLNGVKGLPHVKVSVTPFAQELSPDWPLESKEWIPYGSTSLTVMGFEQKWKGCYFDPAIFNYQMSVNNRDDMLNDEIICTVNSAIEFFKNQDPKSMWFIRPSEDLKQFSGGTSNAQEAWEWLQDAKNCASSGSYMLPGNTYIVIAEPKEISREWRWFIVNGEVISGSQYLKNGQLKPERVTNKEMVKEAQNFADKWLPHPCCTMDLALTKDGISVIEFNCINSSGFYDHDVVSIIHSLYRFSGT